MKFTGIRNLLVLGAIIAANFLLVANSVAEESLSKRKALLKAQAIALTSFELEGASLTDAVRQLYFAGVDADPKGKGVNFLVEEELLKTSPRITLKLKNVTLSQAAEQIAEGAELRLSPEDYGLFFKAKKEAVQSTDRVLKN